MSTSITSLKTEIADAASAAPERLRVGTSVAVIGVLSGALWYGIYAAAAFLFD
ncbi:hypothetical protein [Muricoccus aerilatus]|uniref:hypothetical protein n=1 Tax=Muricoccus aerilatus TaxID=452982 RepID=UPI000A46D5D5|nr:hypothetical protein [Roseomonas aerilata]